MLQAIHPTDLVQHNTKPSRGMKSPLWMHQSFILWLVKTGYYHRHLFSRQSKNPKVQLLHQNPVTLLPQRPWLQDAAASCTEGTRLKGAAFSGLSVFTICASKEGHKEGNHIFACKQWMPQGLASSWESVLQMEGRESLYRTYVHILLFRWEEYQLSALSQSLAHMKQFPFHPYSAISSSLWGTPCTAHQRHLITTRDQQWQQGYSSTSSRKIKVVSLPVITFSLKQHWNRRKKTREHFPRTVNQFSKIWNIQTVYQRTPKSY